jgi:hypothetical protein
LAAPRRQRGSGRGFIDLIGVDGHGDIRVVETKLAGNLDDLLILQGCHWWVGALGDDGYGRWYAEPGLIVRPHRWLWEAWHWPLPRDRVVIHEVCDEPSCVRLDHLKEGSQTDNLMMTARWARDGNRWRAGRGHDRRWMAARSRAIRAALHDGYDPVRLAAALAGVVHESQHQLVLPW